MNTPVESLYAIPPPPEAEALEPTERSVNTIPLVPVMTTFPLLCPKVIPVPATRFNVCVVPAPLFV